MKARTWLALALLTALAPGGGRAGAEEPPPLPGRLQALALDDLQVTRLRAAVVGLTAAARSGDVAGAREARVVLTEEGLAGLVIVWQHLGDPRAPAELAEHLVQVVCASAEPEAEALLVRTARSPLATLRAASADGLAAHEGAEGLLALERLAADPLPGVRAAAWRALFTREGLEVVERRCGLERDPDPGIEARRLVLHRLRGDACEPLGRRTLETWRQGESATLRLAAARLLAAPGLSTPSTVLLEIVRETGYGPAAAVALRWARGVTTVGYDPVEERWAAIEAALAVLGHGDLAAQERTTLVDRCVEWLAHPVAMDPRLPDPIPEDALWRRLPELGRDLLPALERRFLDGGFRAPREGARLLAELEPETALPLLRRLVDRGQPQALRAAASGALRSLGRLGDEALARLLTEPEEEPSIRRDALGALAHEQAAWAVAILAGLLRGTHPETIEGTLDALEQRGEPEARAAYEAYVLSGRHPEERVAGRLSQLFVTWDDLARATFTQALASPHAPLRSAALSLAARFPPSRLAEVLPQLKAREPLLAGAKEVESWIHALARAEPAHLLATLRARWDDLPVGASLASTRCRALAALDLVRSGPHAAAAVDFLLEKAGPSGDPDLLCHALEGLSGRSGHRDAEIDALFARLLEGRGVEGGVERHAEVAASVVTSLGRAARGDLTPQLLPMLARLAPDAEVQHRTVALLRALAFQPWGPLEAAVLALALDPTLPTQVRASAGWLLAARAGPQARERATTWLLGRAQGDVEPAVLLALAAAAGRGGDAAHAERFVVALEEEIRAFHATDPPPDPLAPRLDALPQRVQALSAAAAHAGQGPHVDRLVGLLFEPRYLPWAERVLQVNRLSFVTPDALAALAPPVDPRGTRLETGEEEGSILPPEVVQVALGLKPVGDAALAEALARVLERTRWNAFPDAWPAKLAALLHDPRSGDLARSAAVLEAATLRLEPRAGPFDLALALERPLQLGRAGSFVEAAEAARVARRLLARRGDELFGGPLLGGPVFVGGGRPWERLRALEAAWRACADEAATPGAGIARLEAEAARAHDDDPVLLAELARAAAGARVALEQAEAWAERALTLELRAEGETSLERTAALAEVLLARGRPGAAARRLGQALGDRVRAEDARFHLLLARVLAAHGDHAAARAPLRRALLAEPTLAAGLLDDPAFAGWAADGQLERFLADVEASRRAGEEE